MSSLMDLEKPKSTEGTFSQRAPRSRASFQRALYLLARNLTLWIFKIGWGLRVIGRDNIPQNGGTIIASNHRSYGDPPLVGVSVPREVHFLAKKELFTFRPFGWLITALNAHPLNRAGDIGAFREAQRILGQDQVLIVFPEGKRMKTDALGKAKPGVGLLSFMTGRPIVPTYVHNSGHITTFKRIAVIFGKPLYPTDYGSYEALTGAVMNEIERLREQFLHSVSKPTA